MNDAVDPRSMACFAATQEGHADHDPAYGPSGRYIYYWNSDNPQGYDAPHTLYRLDRTSGQEQRLTFTTDTSTSYAGMFSPRPTPDGQWILFMYRRAEPWAIMAIRPDGTDLVTLFEDSANDAVWVWP